MAPNNKKNPPKNTYALPERVLFDYCLLQIYEEGKKHDEFAHSPDIVQSLRDLVAKGYSSESEVDFENGIKVERIFTSCGLPAQLADGATAEDKNDERVIKLKEEYKKIALQAKNEKLQNIIGSYGENFRENFLKYIGNVHNIKNFDKQVISGPFMEKATTYPSSKNLLSDLKDNFDDLKQSIPNHKLVTGIMGEKIAALVSGVPSGKEYLTFEVNEDEYINKEKNDIIRDNFRLHPDGKKKFFKFMGHMLQYAKDSNPDHIEEIKRLTNTPESSEAIAKRAQTLYDTMLDCLWTYKEEHNRDPEVDRDKYVKNNVDRWIKKLMTGVNDFKSLAFIKADALENVIIGSKEYDELVTQHITIHHKLVDVKYHALVDKKGVPYSQYNEELHPLNNICNMMMVIGKKLHDRKFHQHDGDFLNPKKKKKHNIAYVKRNPTQDIFLAIGPDGKEKTVSMNIPVSGEINKVLSGNMAEQSNVSIVQMQRDGKICR